MDLGVWNEDMKQQLIVANGSVQAIPAIPADIKALYKTVWEISQKVSGRRVDCVCHDTVCVCVCVSACVCVCARACLNGVVLDLQCMSEQACVRVVPVL